MSWIGAQIQETAYSVGPRCIARLEDKVNGSAVQVFMNPGQTAECPIKRWAEKHSDVFF